ncbi:MAG: hypothetical protein Q8S02_12625 [Hydrogenophaga sp.]|nr:hypothetical protein [Hydrogenophaga sp.]
MHRATPAICSILKQPKGKIFMLKRSISVFIFGIFCIFGSIAAQDLVVPANLQGNYQGKLFLMEGLKHWEPRGNNVTFYTYLKVDVDADGRIDGAVTYRCGVNGSEIHCPESLVLNTIEGCTVSGQIQTRKAEGENIYFQGTGSLAGCADARANFSNGMVRGYIKGVRDASVLTLAFSSKKFDPTQPGNRVVIQSVEIWKSLNGQPRQAGNHWSSNPR